MTPGLTSKDFFKATKIENNRLYVHYSEVTGRRIQSIASSDPIFNIDNVENIKIEFGDRLNLKDPTKSTGSDNSQLVASWN